MFGFKKGEGKSKKDEPKKEDEWVRLGDPDQPSSIEEDWSGTLNQPTPKPAGILAWALGFARSVAAKITPSAGSDIGEEKKEPEKQNNGKGRGKGKSTPRRK